MSKLLGLVLLLMVLASYGAAAPSNPSPTEHYTNLIVGGGPAGLYTAWRLSSSRAKNETTAIYEWSKTRLGGRVYTKEFRGGQFLELGAMRWSDQHVLVQQVVQELNLTNRVRKFPLTDDSLYHLRGKHMFLNDIKTNGAPYNTEHNTTDPRELFDVLIHKKLKLKLPKDRAGWCRFFDEGKFPANVKSSAFSKNDNLGNIGYWNLLMDQLEDEGLAYAADASGFTSFVLNSNSANAISLSTHSGNYTNLRGGYKELVSALEREIRQKQVEIEPGQRLTEFHWNADDKKFYATFQNCSNNDTEYTVTSDRLFLCVPKRSLDIIRETDVVGEWKDKQRRVLKHTAGEFYINSVIQTPAYKIALLYKEPWWLNATYKPFFGVKNETYAAQCQKNYGPAVTDLPLRNVYYFGNNGEMTKKDDTPLYGILASYDDMENVYFWQVLEAPANKTFHPLAPADAQALSDGGDVTAVMHRMLREQLNKVHFGDTTMQVPEAVLGYFMNWGHDPYGSGYHTWKAHYSIPEAQYYMTRPSEAIGVEVPVYVAGETYAYDQGWIEGAFATAETVLVDKIGLKPFLKTAPGYPLICRPKSKS